MKFDREDKEQGSSCYEALLASETESRIKRFELVENELQATVEALTEQLSKHRDAMLVLKTIKEHIDELDDDDGDATFTAKLIIRAFHSYSDKYGPIDWDGVV